MEGDPMFRLLLCSFCRRRDSNVAKLVAGPRILFIGPRVYICHACVAASLKIMESGSPAPRHV
jgi:ClpX C4-type zinc finger